jgi:prophage antirepressor-like protein
MNVDKKTQSAAISDSRPLTEFSFSENKKMQTVLINNQPWFVAQDVCAILKLSNASESMKSLDDDEYLTSEILRAGQTRNVNLVNESGLYNLIFRSNKPEAKAFRRWVTGTVLPQIRLTGGYNLHKTSVDHRGKVFEWQEFNNRPVRVIELGGTMWYEIAPYAQSIGVFTCAHQIAGKLNKIYPMAKKIWLFGMSGPGYFTTQHGINLITVGTRTAKVVGRALPFAIENNHPQTTLLDAVVKQDNSPEKGGEYAK